MRYNSFYPSTITHSPHARLQGGPISHLTTLRSACVFFLSGLQASSQTLTSKYFFCRRDQQSETLQKYTLVSIVFTDDLGQVSHPLVRCKITLNKNSNIENSFLWEVEKTILGSLRYGDYRLRTTAGRALSFVCSTGLSRANIER